MFVASTNHKRRKSQDVFFRIFIKSNYAGLMSSALLRTLTVDNGVEFAKYEALSRKLSIDI
jgi:IS30 family transposase